MKVQLIQTTLTIALTLTLATAAFSQTPLSRLEGAPTATSKISAEVLKGTWVRPDGGYRIVIQGVGAASESSTRCTSIRRNFLLQERRSHRTQEPFEWSSSCKPGAMRARPTTFFTSQRQTGSRAPLTKSLRSKNSTFSSCVDDDCTSSSFPSAERLETDAYLPRSGAPSRPASQAAQQRRQSLLAARRQRHREIGNSICRSSSRSDGSVTTTTKLSDVGRGRIRILPQRFQVFLDLIQNQTRPAPLW